jgi:hypothetical protein
MKTVARTVLAAAAVFASVAASAQPFDSRPGPSAWHEIDQRQARQEQRIEHGFARGDLTRHEVRTLRQEQFQIARFEARARADGRLGRREVQQLHAMLDQADAHIRALRHNGPARPRG